MFDPSLNRRDFLLGLVGAGTLSLRGPSAGVVPSVAAIPTVFFSQPDARTSLVRFVVSNSDAVAGRLRVYDQTRRQLGTAGVIGVGGRLYGELWLPLERETTYFTDLELPGVRGVIRSTHRVEPRRRWTLYWITVGDPGHLEGTEYLDHPAFLASGAPDAGTAVLEPAGSAAGLSSLPLMLAGMGVHYMVRRNASDAGPVQLRARDGSSVTMLPVAPGGTPDELGFFSGGEELSRRVERWVESVASLQSAGQRQPAALVVGSVPGGSPQVDEWATRFAYPRIVVGKLEEFTAGIPANLTSTTPPGPAARRPGAPRPPREEISAARDAERRARVDRLVAPLAARLSGSKTGLAAVAAQFAFPEHTTLVFNPTPFTRSDVAAMPDGTERVVADVPATGYLCVKRDGSDKTTDQGGRWVRDGDELVLRSPALTLRFDPATGAIRSARGANEREWVRSDGPGWNAFDGFRLEAVTPERNTLVGQRLTLERAGPARSRVSTTVTLYDALPWIDIRNEFTPGGNATSACLFPFALEQPRVTWEVPGGFEIGAAPVRDLVHLRWIRLESNEDVVFFRGLDAPDASVDERGVLTSVPPTGTSRYRLGFASRFTLAGDAWRFGWSTEPLVTVPVPGTGPATLASYGSMIQIDQGGVAILDLRTARDRDGVIVLLQELLGTTRDVTLGHGLLAFTGGRRVDFLERDLGPLPDLGGKGVAAPLAGYGITALRLTGVGLAGA
ncbi:MAG: hypothetical protein EXR93_06895 [Gemmatimonadetes bacterium]|nr:hypothetical protein [Gemmatimonadota bacterium]